MGGLAGLSPLWPGFDTNLGHMWPQFVLCVVLSHATRVFLCFFQFFPWSKINTVSHKCEVSVDEGGMTPVRDLESCCYSPRLCTKGVKKYVEPPLCTKHIQIKRKNLMKTLMGMLMRMGTRSHSLAQIYSESQRSMGCWNLFRNVLLFIDQSQTAL